MNDNLVEVQKLGQQNMDKALKIIGEWHEGWRTVSALIKDFTKRSFDDADVTVDKLLTTNPLDQAMAIQTDFAKRTFDSYVHELSRIGSIYAVLFKNSYDPIEHDPQNSAQR